MSVGVFLVTLSVGACGLIIGAIPQVCDAQYVQQPWQRSLPSASPPLPQDPMDMMPSSTRRPGSSDANGDLTVSAAELKIPSKASAAMQKAREALMKRRTADAARYIAKALEIYPHYSEALAIRGIMERDQDPLKALEDTQNAVEYDPYFGEGFVALGSVYTTIGRPDDAIRALDRATDLMPDCWQVYFELSRALATKRDYLAALDQIQKASSLGPQKDSAFRLVKAHVFIGLKDRASAVAELEAYLQEQPKSEKAPQVRIILEKLQTPKDLSELFPKFFQMK